MFVPVGRHQVYTNRSADVFARMDGNGVRLGEGEGSKETEAVSSKITTDPRAESEAGALMKNGAFWTRGREIRSAHNLTQGKSHGTTTDSLRVKVSRGRKT